MESILLGCIAEPFLGDDPERTRMLRESNRRVVAELPEDDDWPPLLRGLFAGTDCDSLRGGYRGSILHFGGRFKSIEEEWHEWLGKYEALLRRLYWQSSVVHLHTEAAGDFRFDWVAKHWENFRADPPTPTAEWEWWGPFRRWGG